MDINETSNTINNKNNLVQIDKELLKNIKNIFEVVSSRIQWKTNELLPVGIILKQIDDLIKQE